MASYKDWIVNHPKKGRIPLGKLSHNDVCRYCFELYIENQALADKIKSFINTVNDIEERARKNAKKRLTLISVNDVARRWKIYRYATNDALIAVMS